MFLAFRPRPTVFLTVSPPSPGSPRSKGRTDAGRLARWPGSWQRWAGIGLLAGASVGCSDDGPQPAQCGPPGPSFAISVHAPEPRLPDDLTVTALYGAGEETYHLSSAAQHSEVLFCSPQQRRHDPGGGSSGAPGQAQGGSSGDGAGEEVLRCELWTDSSVTVRVSSARFLPLEQELEPTVDRCGVVTTNVDLTLEWPPE